MAIVSSTNSVPNPGYNDWKVVSSTDTDTGKITFTVYGGSGSVVNAGDAAYLTSFFNGQAAEAPEDAGFYQSLISTIQGMQATAQESVTAAQGQDPLTPEEQAKLDQSSPNSDAESLENIQKSVQNEADQEFGRGVVEVGEPWLVDSSGSQRQPAQSDEQQKVALNPIPNRLKQYPSYIYSLSLHILTPTQYNEVVKSQSYTPENVLVASAGRYSASLPRNEFFSKDYFFDEVEFTTTLYPNQLTRNTNLVNGSMTLIEPYGFAFVNDMILVADRLGIKNYTQAPYLLQLEFFAIGENGVVLGSIEELKKLIPIRIIKVDTQVTLRGSEYKIAFTAFNQSAYDITTVTIPANFEVAAKNVREFFQSIEGTAEDKVEDVLDFRQEQTAQAAREQKAQVRNKAYGADKTRLNQTAGGTVQTETNPNYKPENPLYYRAKSVGSAMNAWGKALRDDRKTRFSDRYRFEFIADADDSGEDNIGDSPIIDETINTPPQTEMSNEPIKMFRASTGEQIKTYDPGTLVTQINRGTTIEKLLDYVIRKSQYIKKQLLLQEDPDYQEKKKDLEKVPLKWYRILASIKLLDFDVERNTYAREITYRIVPYKIYNLPSELGPRGVQINPAKIYEYIFTGKNDDVFDFDLKFNFLWFLPYTAYRNNIPKAWVGGGKTTNYSDSSSASYYRRTPENPNAVMPPMIKYVIQNSIETSTVGGAVTPEELTAVDLYDSLLSRDFADMVSVKLKILGDPDFIKQDEVFQPRTSNKEITVNQLPSVDPRLLPGNGSLKMDTEALYAQLIFNTPRDYDERTGLLEKLEKNRSSISVFSGLYNIVKIRNNFNGGEFTQELTLARAFNQQFYDYVTGQAKTGDQREGTQTNENLPTNSPVTPTPTRESTAAEEAGGIPGQEQTAATTATEPTTGPSTTQTDLSNVRSTGDTVDINKTNEPAPTASATDQEGQLLNGILSDLSKSESATSPTEKLKYVNSQLDQWQQLKTIYQNQGDTQSLAAAQSSIDALLTQRELLIQPLGR